MRDRLKVLVVDDDHDCADSLAEILTLNQHDSLAAYGGEGALAVATTFKPDIVLLDLNMPRMDGYATARALRRLSLANPPLLIAFTALSGPADIDATKRAGFDFHVSKPCEFDDLILLLDGAISARLRAESEGRVAHPAS